MTRLEIITNREYWVEALECKDYNGTTNIVFADNIVKIIEEALTLYGVVRPEILDTYESGCIESKQQEDPTIKKIQLCCDEQELVETEDHLVICENCNSLAIL